MIGSHYFVIFFLTCKEAQVSFARKVLLDNFECNLTFGIAC